MISPFLVHGPALVQCSGGRTSALMLRRILDEGPLRPDVHVAFADTGKEREETYAFLEQIQERWGVPLWWLAFGHLPALSRQRFQEGFTPLDLIIAERGYLPGPRLRFCTEILKVRTMRNFMRGLGYEDWTIVVGMRADEPIRVARLRSPDRREPWDIAVPLYDAGVSKADVMAFWASQPFDLGLEHYEGNCDLCFLKAIPKRLRIMRERPDLAAWWVEQERATGKRFRPDAPSYATLLQRVTQQPEFDFEDSDLVDCMCGD
jgi:3'-phosphoadenosine 5'-phosphosulfate sulfotransferase (PAPS reductase)/FAD synthetase